MKKCCISTLITFLVIVVLITVAVVVVLNLTPKQLHIDQISVGGSTLAEAGLADTKIITILKGFKSLNKKESDVVGNGYDAEAEKPLAASFFENSTLATTDNYGSLLDTKVVYSDGRHALVMKDTTLAYVMDSVIGSAFTTESGENAAAALSVREVTITKTEAEDGTATAHMRIVIGVNTNAYLPESIRSSIDKVKVVKVPDYVYLVFDSDFEVSSTGKIIFTNTDVCVGGDKDNPLNEVFINVVSSAMGKDGTTEDNKKSICNLIFDKVGAGINNIGDIASAGESNGVIGVVEYGLAGVDNGLLRFVTHTIVS